MKFRTALFFTAILTLTHSFSGAGERVNAYQYFYVVKRLFPEAEIVNVFISKSMVVAEQQLLQRAGVQNKLTPRIYTIDSAADIGQRVRELGENSLLILYPCALLEKKSSMLYCLSKCKSKQVAIISSSRGYSELGALLGIFENDQGTIELVLNLKHNAHLRNKFTDDVITEMGINQVIQ